VVTIHTSCQGPKCLHFVCIVSLTTRDSSPHLLAVASPVPYLQPRQFALSPGRGLSCSLSPTATVRPISWPWPPLFPASSRSLILPPVLCIWQYGGVLLHLFFASIPRPSSTPCDLATSFQTSFCCPTSFLHAQPTAIFSHACTLPGHCLYICSMYVDMFSHTQHTPF
jgi:hypothetical protein